MKLKEDEVVKPFKHEIVKRPWGFYGVYADNEPNTTKILYIKKDQMLSMQYHFKRAQFYLALDDDFIIEYSSEPVPDSIINETDELKRFKELEDFLNEKLVTEIVKEGEMFGFKEKVVHRAIYKGSKEYGRCLDVAFGENDEEDIVRIRDKYKRGNGDSIK